MCYAESIYSVYREMVARSIVYPEPGLSKARPLSVPFFLPSLPPSVVLVGLGYCLSPSIRPKFFPEIMPHFCGPLKMVRTIRRFFLPGFFLVLWIRRLNPLRHGFSASSSASSDPSFQVLSGIAEDPWDANVPPFPPS